MCSPHPFKNQTNMPSCPLGKVLAPLHLKLIQLASALSCIPVNEKPEATNCAGDPFTRLLAPSQSRVFQADTTGQVIHIGMQAQKADTEAGPFVRVAFVLTGEQSARQTALGLHFRCIGVHGMGQRCHFLGCLLQCTVLTAGTVVRRKSCA